MMRGAGLIILGVAVLAACADESGDAPPAADMRPVDRGELSPDMPVPDPLDLGVDGGAGFDCDAVGDPWAAVVSDGRCAAVDIFDNTTCTPDTRLVCQQTVTCDPPFEDPGSVIACCDGATWVRLEEEPDLCGFPADDLGAPDATDLGVDPGGDAGGDAGAD